MKFTEQNFAEALEASGVSAINGLASLAFILRKRGLIADADISALYESMSLPLGLPKFAENPAVQEMQLNVDQLFSTVLASK